jgi:hypothetical protein
MVSPRRRRNLRAFLAAGTFGIVGHVKNGLNQERFIAKATGDPKLLVGPGEN